MDAPEPWERQPGETDRQFYAFTVYRDQPLTGGRRSLAGVTKVLQRTSSWRVERWSVQNQWVPRALAWDDEQDRVWRASVLREKHRIAQKHARLAASLQARALEGLAQLDTSAMSAGDVVALMKAAREFELGVYGRLNDEAEGPGAGSPVVVINQDLLPLSGLDPLLALDVVEADPDPAGLRAVN